MDFDFMEFVQITTPLPKNLISSMIAMLDDPQPWWMKSIRHS